MNLKSFNINKMKFLKTSFLFSLILFNIRQCLSDDVDYEYIHIGMRALVLSTEIPESVLSSLASYGIAYDNLIYNCDNPLNDQLYLFDENNGYPKYNMIVIANGGMRCTCNGEYISALKQEHWDALNQYEAKYNIRRVTLNEVSDVKEIGVQDYEYKGKKDSTVSLKPADNAFTQYLFNNTGILDTAPLNTLGANYNLVKIVDDKISTPVLYYDIENEKAIAAVYSVLRYGNERLTFFMSSNKGTPTGLILNHLWIPWASKYIYTGFRRIYLTQHVDDVFSTQTLISSPVAFNHWPREYSASVEDFDNLIQYQKDILSKMPAGSSYQLEFAYNGYGLIDKSIYQFYIADDAKVSNSYVKPKGTGICRWPSFPYNVNWLESELSKIRLYNYFSAPEKHENFYWISHGFTHQLLNTATSNDVKNQIDNNVNMAIRLGIYEKDIYSKKSIITPHSSGLHNVDAIETFLSSGITSASGNINRDDITNDDTINAKKAYLPWVTTINSSNIDGFPVIPRIPTMMFNECSTPLENTIKYNQIFEGTGMESTFDEILNRDSQKALLFLLQLRHNPFKFHQANIRSNGVSDKKSLIQLWTEKLVDQYNKYVIWPIVSLKTDDLHQTYIDRQNFEKCDLTQRLVYNNTHIIAISLNSNDRACKVPIALPYGIGILEEDLRKHKDILEVEQVNEFDPITLWVELNRDSVVLDFEPAIEWGEYKINTRYGTLEKKSLPLNDDNYYFKKTDSYDNDDDDKTTYNTHRIITNVIKSVLKYNASTDKMKNEYGYTSEQLNNIKALKELEKSRLYAEGNSKIQEKKAKEDKIKNDLNKLKNNFSKSVEQNFE
ncbi:hypothetical protein BCR32DRAFT_294337 [Anaeromyces robustus]|uniref:Uncharacterized protein n=1 Tax=Anaeromyces robustus TaxID=1754192 RepID=A0A1Y1X2F8_9FUNG|nr:hypothetical protein BCR32DRAFT_294337 [Anaeromyces robustus]|eukprot:ORX79586.1 hypothetical protein BCR32DRAFT_294337 [Anaeromyces robustus]